MMNSFLAFAAATFLVTGNHVNIIIGVQGYTHKRCTAAVAADFSFDDCYLPPQNPDLLLSSASFVFSHNAATGYIQPNALSKAGLSWWYSKNQVGTVYQQLSAGARALDLRPLYQTQVLNNGTVINNIIFHHGAVHIASVTFEQLLQDTISWCRDNPDELVILLPSHFDYYDSSSSSSSSYVTDDDRYSLVSSMKSIYQQYGVAYFHCSDVYGLTVGEVMELSQIGNGEQGYLIALDGQDGSTSCIKENYIEDELVTCYDATLNVSCKSSTESLERLKTYVVASVQNEATDDAYTNGPPADLEKYPFNEIQALWQVDAHAVTSGMRRASSILQDNRDSKLNAAMVEFIYSGAFQGGDSLSLFAVDNVELHGNALLSVLRNTCGQSENDETACGSAVPPPRMSYFHITMKWFVVCFLAVYVTIASLTTAWVRKQQQRHGKQWKLHTHTNKLWNTMVARFQENMLSDTVMQMSPQTQEGAVSSRREQLL